MKSRKLMGIFALASCVMLAGCGEPPAHVHTYSEDWSSNETEHWHAATCEHTDQKSDLGAHVDNDKDNKCDICSKELPIPEPMIKITDLPVEIVIGDEIDLKDYIKTKGDARYDVNFDDASFALVEVDGTKVKAIAEGEVSFSVSCKGEEVSAVFSVVSAIRKQFLEWTEGVGYNYALFTGVYDYEDLDDEGYPKFLGYARNSVHADDFMMNVEFGVNEERTAYIPGGFAVIDGKCYFYTTDENEENAAVEPGYWSMDTFETYNCPLELNDELFDTMTLKESVLGFETEALVLNDSRYAFDICAGIAGVTDAEDTYGNVYEPSSCAFIFDTYELDDGSSATDFIFVPFVSKVGSTGMGQPYDIYYISTAAHPFDDETDFEVPAVREMIDNKEVPDPVDYSDAKAKLNSFINASSYTVDYDFGWFRKNGAEVAPKDYPDMEGLVFQDCADSFVRGVSTIAITDSAIAEYVANDGGYDVSKGYMKVDDLIYRYSLMDGEYGASETSYGSVTELTDARFGYLKSVDGEANPLYPDDLCYDYDADNDVYFMNIGAQNALLKKLFLANSTLSGIITKALDPYLIDYGRDLYSFFEGAFMFEENAAKISFTLKWEEDLFFIVDVIFSEANSTVVPADIVEGVTNAVHAG